MKTTLTAYTRVGQFTRTTATPYTHIVVWASSRATTVAAEAAAGERGIELIGKTAQWVKDRGYGVTWHKTERAAAAAAAGKWVWDLSAVLVGVFAVGAVACPERTPPKPATLLRMVLDECDVLNPDGSARPLSAELVAMIRAGAR